MRWAFLLPLILWGQTFFGNFSSGFISRSGKRNQNQPASTFEIRLNGGFNFHGISAGINLYFNSDDRFTPQATSFYSLTPSWSWGRIYIGNFSPSFSPLTLSGISLMGGGIELFPGIFRLFIVSGRVKRASTDSTELAYERSLWGIRLGLGRLTGTRITLINSKDIASSANDSTMRAHGIYPQENWVLEVSQRISLFGGKFKVAGLGAVTLLTRDINAIPIEIGKVPDWVKKNFRINSSTSADYAYRVESSLRLKNISLDYTHGYAGPGYESHGISGTISDKVEDMVRTNLTFGSRFIMGLSYSISRDNIIETRNGTSNTQNASLYITLLASRNVSFFSSAMVSKLDKTGDVDTFNMKKNNTLSVSSGVSLRFSRSLSLNLNGGFARVKTETYISNASARSTSASVALNHRLSRIFSYGLGYSMTSTQSDTLTGVVHSPSVSIKFNFKRLNLSFSSKAGVSQGKTIFNLGASGGLKITRKDVITFRISSTLKKEKDENSLEFRAFYTKSFRTGR